jgi:hypothetical protein
MKSGAIYRLSTRSLGRLTLTAATVLLVSLTQVPSVIVSLCVSLRSLRLCGVDPILNRRDAEFAETQSGGYSFTLFTCPMTGFSIT